MIGTSISMEAEDPKGLVYPSISVCFSTGREFPPTVPTSDQYDDYELDLISGVVGCYQVDPSLYSTEEHNDWHYVRITWNDDGTFEWRNRAGYHWSLAPIPKGEDDWDTTKLQVGPECPYFKDGHTFAAVEWEGEPGHSVVSTIKGPWGEAFLREDACGPVNPFKTPPILSKMIKYVRRGLNDWDSEESIGNIEVLENRDTNAMN